MSGIAAVIRFDGGRVEPGSVEAMTAAMSYRGPDGIAHWSDGQAALGHCMLHTTAESLEEKQPLASPDGNRVLVFDGWLSNPEELRSDLMSRGARLRDRSDAELVLHAYEAWGEQCPARIDGEFAFLIWDRQRREAFLARDHAGLNSLHYCWDGAQLTVATDIVGVLAGPGIDALPNRGKIAEYLACEFTELEETIWQGVQRAPPAHWLRIGTSGVQRGKYWQPPQEIGIVHKRDEDYFAHYRDLLADCVRRASRSHLPMACDVSGGLDSSAVFAMAHDLHRQGRLPAPELKGYTWFFGDARGSGADEIEYARAIAAHLGVDINEIKPFLPEADWFAERGKADRDFVGFPNAAMSIAIGQALVSDGCRVILNGVGGDEWLSGSPFYLSELVDAHDWRALSGEFVTILTQSGLRAAAWHMIRYGSAHHLPRPLLAVRRAFLNQLKSRRPTLRAWMPEDLQQLLSLRQSSTKTPNYNSIRNMPRRAMHLRLSDPWVGVFRDQASRQSARLGLEMRVPMYSRKFIEFALATPETIKIRHGLEKFAHRQALSELLPPMVTNRTSKAHFAHAFDLYLLDKSNNALARALSGSSSGFIDTQAASHLLEKYRSDPEDRGLIWPLWSMFAIENVFSYKRAESPPGNSLGESDVSR